MKFQFNTGRLYARDGQRIDVEAVTDGTTWVVKFWDRSRHIDGGFTFADWESEGGYMGEVLMREIVLGRYDRMEYTQLWFFEYIRRQERSSQGFLELVTESERTLNAPRENSGHDAMARATAVEVVRKARQLGIGVRA